MKILICTDGSPSADAAGQFLARLPHDRQLELTVLSVVEPVETHGSREVMEWLKDQEQTAQQACEAANGRIADMFQGANVNLTTKIASGHPAQEILQAARDLNVRSDCVRGRGTLTN